MKNLNLSFSSNWLGSAESRIRRKLLVVLFTLVPMLANAYYVEIDGIYYILNSSWGMTAEVTSGDSKYSGSIVIPEYVSYNGESYEVTSIGSYAFMNCSNLTDVKIPNSVTNIGDYAFYECSGLISVIISDFVAGVGDNFSGFSSSDILDDTPNTVTSVGCYAFANCSSLTSIDIPSSVTRIEEGAFCNCHSLSSITIPNSVISIGDDVFNGCTGLISIDISNSVISIGNGAFAYCYSLTYVNIPNSVTSIGDRAFSCCESLSWVSISNSVTSIENGTFEHCKSLMVVVIPNSVTSIGDRAFSACWSLAMVDIPNSVTNIGESAFGSCSSLTSVTIPNSVKSIGDEVFRHCSSLTSVDIPNSVTSIGNGAFSVCSSLTSVDIPNSVISIGDFAFEDCYRLKSVTIPNSVKSIGKCIFKDCENLTSINMDADNPNYCMHDNVLFDKEEKTLILCIPTKTDACIIPNSITSICDYAFYECSKLTSVEIPNSVTSIGHQAFWGCTKLNEIISHISVPFVIGEDVFYAWGVNDCTLYVPQGTAELYKNTAGWNEIKNIVEMGKFSEEEWASLKALYGKIAPNNTEWAQKWQNVITTVGIEGVGLLDGLTIENGHVIGIDLANQKLVGQFPSILLTFPKVKEISLNGNHFDGDIQTIIEELSLYVTNNDPSFVSELQSLDLSGNNLTGNIGALAYSTETTPSILSRFPSLKTWKASNNKFEDIYPALPASITNLDISNQKMDRVVELNMSDLSLEDFSSKVPTILLYDKVNRTYKNSINLLCTKADLATFNKYNTKEWAMQLQIDDNQLSIPYVSAQKEYHGESGDTLNVLNMTGNDATDGSSFRIALSFNQGDANFINGVDATDLQTTILYAFGGYRNYPFNFTAADTYKDGIINVQDVICTVNILLDSHNEQAMEARSKKVNMADMEAKPDTDAYLYVKDGKVFLHSRVPVASLSIKADGNVKWNIERLGLSQSTANGNVVAYSLNGTTIPSYEDVVLGECTHAKLYSVSLSDTDAQPISVNFGNSATSIINTSNATNGDMKIYDVSGYRLNKMRKGINIIRNNGTTKKIYK